jgi:short-subunit dehydrogenase
MNAIITGATKGIGRAIAENFCERGFTIAVCSRHEEELKTMAQELESRFDSCKVYYKATNLSSKEDTLRFADYCIESLGEVHVLVNNAGIFSPGLLLEEDETMLEEILKVNLFSVYHLTRRIAPLMVSCGHGYIVNISSIAGIGPYPNGGSYSISKFALRGFTMTLREELKETGVKVTSVLPGATWSNSWAGVDLPESRLMKARDIAVAVSSIFDMSPSAVMEEIIIRPQLGDL